MIYLKLVFRSLKRPCRDNQYFFLGYFIHQSTSKKEKKHNFTKAQFEKDKTTVWIKWPTQGRAIYV